MSVPAGQFERDYSETVDPFGHEDSPFELTRIRAQVALLANNHYRSGLELGCSTGILTALIAPRCDALLALDCAPSAIARVRERCAAMPHVRAEAAILPAQFPAGTFDLITFSEFGYYLDADDLERLHTSITRATEPGAHLILGHMTISFGPYGDHALPSTHEQVHAPYHADPNWKFLRRLTGFEEDPASETYWCDLLQRL